MGLASFLVALVALAEEAMDPIDLEENQVLETLARKVLGELENFDVYTQ